ncbi:MAG: O-antigen ligase family protein [Candidatus Eisenbacteria bacterium]
MDPTLAPPSASSRTRWLLALCGFALIAFFAWSGVTSKGLVMALAAGALFLVRFAPRIPGHMLLVFVPLLLLTPNFAGWRYFDALVPVIVIAAWAATLRVGDRRAFELHGPGLVALAILVAPLPGLVRAESPASFLGSYKELLVYAMVFLSLRRLVTRRTSILLLWALPVLGLAIALELFAKTHGVGGLLARSGFRTFYTDLVWGSSNLIASVLLISLCGTALIATLDSRPWVRLLLLASGAVSLEAFLILSSRSAAVALVVFLLVLVFGLGGRFRLAASGTIIAVVAAGLSLSSGRLLVSRFADPAEYASWAERQHLWAGAWSRFLEHPWIGIGLNQGRLQGDLMASARAHNWLLDTLMEQGMIGGIVLLIAVAALSRLCWRVEVTGDPGSDHRVRVVCYAFVAAVILQSMVEPTLLSYIVTLPFLWFIAWLTMHDRTVTRAT